MRPNDMPRPFAPDHSDGDDLVERLVSAGNDQLSGLPLLKLTVEAANEIGRLRACLKYEEHRFATQSTHSEGCHSFGPRHYECALQEVERLRAEVALLRNERDFLVGEYERAVECGEQGYIHCAGHLFNAITNARIDANIAERELAALRERIEKAPLIDGSFGDWLYLLDSQGENIFGHRVRLVRED